MQNVIIGARDYEMSKVLKQSKFFSHESSVTYCGITTADQFFEVDRPVVISL